MVFMAEEIAVAPDMTELEARQAVSDIKRGINTVRARVYDLDRRKGWKALGYRSFAACCMEEFPELHARTIEKQLGAARVEAKLQDLRPSGRNFKIGDMPEAHLRPLVSVKNDDETLVAAYAKAQDIAEEENGGKLTEAIVTRAVQETKPQPAASSPVASVEPKWSESELERKAIVEAGGTVVANMHADGDQSLLAWARQTGRFLRIDRQSDWVIHLRCLQMETATPFAIPTKFSLLGNLAFIPALPNSKARSLAAGVIRSVAMATTSSASLKGLTHDLSRLRLHSPGARHRGQA